MQKEHKLSSHDTKKKVKFLHKAGQGVMQLNLNLMSYKTRRMITRILIWMMAIPLGLQAAKSPWHAIPEVSESIRQDGSIQPET